MKIRYRSGYKYCLAEAYTVNTMIKPKKTAAVDGYIILTPDGTLSISRGYAWDGPSGPTIDTKNFMRGSLVHDALFQLIREGHLDEEWFKPANEELYKICLEDGMSWFRARYVKLGVDVFGGYAIKPNKEILEAP